VICFSHLRWDFVYQRPNHLMARAARGSRVYYVEEPLHGNFAPSLGIDRRDDGLHIVLPYLPQNLDEQETQAALEALLRDLVRAESIDRPICWYYTPMALDHSRWLEPEVTVYDAMDELSAFLGAPERMRTLEAELLERADVVFTGGHSLYAAKRKLHPGVHAMPSAVDARHFSQARKGLPEPVDQVSIPGPRIGWFGVIDERMDMALLSGVAERRPDWSFVLVGPVVKIDPTSIPQLPNVHVLGSRPYASLPAYIGRWDVAMMPFARNAATRYISPTKTLEYLAAGRPVVSTSIADVVSPYGELGMVRIADDPQSFIAAIEAALAEDPAARRAATDAYLGRVSWDETWSRMWALVLEARDRARSGAVPNQARAAGRASSPLTASARR
jgi:UDP-galactopyranose mutase